MPEPSAKLPTGLGVIFWVSVSWIVVLVFVALFADVLPIRDPEALGIITREVEPFERPGWNAWFGSDGQGKDLFANVVHGARPALVLGLTVTLLAASIGTVRSGTPSSSQILCAASRVPPVEWGLGI